MSWNSAPPSNAVPWEVMIARRSVTRRKKAGRAADADAVRDGDGEESSELEDAREGVATPEEMGDGSPEPGPCLL